MTRNYSVQIFARGRWIHDAMIEAGSEEQALERWHESRSGTIHPLRARPADDAHPEEPSYEQRKTFALIGARIARKSAEARSEALLGDDLAYEDAETWRHVCSLLEGDNPEAAGDAISLMETGCRDFLDLAPLGGPREALAHFAGLELLG